MIGWIRHCTGAAAVALVAAAFSSAQALTPSEALDRYLAISTARQETCSESMSAVQIEARIPKLRREGGMSGIKQVSHTGQVVYRGLRFTGDTIIKNRVIARFLAYDTKRAAGRNDEAAVSRQYYWFTYVKTSDYNGHTDYIYRLRPRRKQPGVFRGELWLNAETAAPLRLWGDFAKSPSIYVRSFRFVQDYYMGTGCTRPLRLLVTVEARLVGTVELEVWFRPALANPGAAESVANSLDPQSRQMPK